MFHKPVDTELSQKRIDPEMGQLVPLSHLQLDLEPPAEGWTVYLEGRGVAVMHDDLGRVAIARSDAKQLFTEQAENEARKAQLRAAAEQRAVEQDQQWRAQLGTGISAAALGGMSMARRCRRLS